MADVICSDVCLWIRDIGCGVTRCALLGLEPGSRIWMLVEDEPVLFERMRDGSDGRSTRGLKPVGDTKDSWTRIYRERKNSMVGIEFTERPADAGKSVAKYLGKEA